jgi:hypothetical protein
VDKIDYINKMTNMWFLRPIQGSILSGCLQKSYFGMHDIKSKVAPNVKWDKYRVNVWADGRECDPAGTAKSTIFDVW